MSAPASFAASVAIDPARPLRVGQLGTLVVVALGVASMALSEEGPRQSSGPASRSVVYFFFTGRELRTMQVGGTPSVPILMNGQQVAKVAKGRFVGIAVPPGRHVFASRGFRTRPEETAITLDVGTAQDIFVRLEVGVVALKWWAHLRVVSDREGRVMVGNLQPLDGDDVVDRARVTLDPVPQDEGRAPAWLFMPPQVLPEEDGVYFVSSSGLLPLPSEPATARDTMYGLTAVVAAPRSRMRVSPPAEFVVRSPPQTTAEEHVLVQLFARDDRREFRMLTARRGWEGPEPMFVPFEVRRLGDRRYAVRVVALPRGEYAFVPPGSTMTAPAGTSGVVRSFGVD